MYKTVLFDLDGTLLNTLEDIAAAANHALSVLGFPQHPPDAYRQMVGNSSRKLVERMLPEENRGVSTQAVAFELYTKTYAKSSTVFTCPYPGIPALLGKLKSEGVQLGVLSNKDDINVQLVISKYFPQTFDAAAGLREGFAPKPDPASVLEMLRILEADPASTLYCGDSDVDVLTSHNAGLACCGVSWGFRGEHELRAAGANFIVQDAVALQQLILGH